MVCKTIYIGSNPIFTSVIDVRMVEPKIVALGLAGSNPVYHPIVGSVLVRSRSHKPQVRQFDSDPRNKKDFEF